MCVTPVFNFACTFEMFLISRRRPPSWRFKHGDRCVKFKQNTLMTSFFQIFTVSISNYVYPNCFVIFNIFFLFFCDCVVAYRTLFFYTNYWKYAHFFYATIIASRMPTPSLWIYLKTYQFFKITEKCSIYYHIFILMYCVVTRSPLRLFSDQNFGKYVYMVNLLLQRITVGVLRSFSDLSFRIQLTKLPYLVSSFIYNIYSPGS